METDRLIQPVDSADGSRKTVGTNKNWLLIYGAILGVVIYGIVELFLHRGRSTIVKYNGTRPFSIVDPESLGIHGINRESSRPGIVFKNLYEKNIPLPTNSWLESLFIGETTTGEANRVFQIPFVIDTSGYIPGARAHPTHVQANDRQVQMTFESRNGLTLGAVETMLRQPMLIHDNSVPHGVARLSAVLEWRDITSTATMHSAIVRGEPYMKMEYLNASPRIYMQRSLSKSKSIVVDSSVSLSCSDGHSRSNPVTVQKELSVTFDTADATWLIFVSEPMEFVCTNILYDDSDLIDESQKDWQMNADWFELHTTKPVQHGMVRVAMVNNCTTGQNPINCEKRGHPRDTTEFTKLIRDHSDAYPTGESDINFVFPPKNSDEEELHLYFNWAPAYMSRLANPASKAPTPELIMFALPHHQERIMPTSNSSNKVQYAGCIPTLHGRACLIQGSSWCLLEHLHRIGFNAPRPPRPEMVESIRSALLTDLTYQLPTNYKNGAGDTYFSGKMLAKLARIILIADEVKGVDEELVAGAMRTLQDGVETWIGGTGFTPLLYDRDWGGIISCGCLFDGETQGCFNQYPDCPALENMGLNFGAGFYNDHHFHYGYHIYSAAVLAHFKPEWGRLFYQKVLLMVRDIANPSAEDPFFPTWRHKDFYLGSSWANGIMGPNPNGRNQESSSEAIAAYEAVAMFGEVMRGVFMNDTDPALAETALHVRDMGRLLLATELRSAKTYWHVMPVESNVTRVYPAIYKPRIVGMLWSMLAQEQTWFGAEPYKSYGIQLMPLTPVAEQRDSVDWVRVMLPPFNQSCAIAATCTTDGWSVLVLVSEAVLGNWEYAWRELMLLNDTVFTSAGGNGHSRSNSLWYIATRPEIVQ